MAGGEGVWRLLTGRQAAVMATTLLTVPGGTAVLHELVGHGFLHRVDSKVPLSLRGEHGRRAMCDSATDSEACRSRLESEAVAEILRWLPGLWQSIDSTSGSKNWG